MPWVPLLAVVAGFGLLVWGADRFVAGAAALARNLGVSPLVIGLTVVGIGTSAPEIFVSAMAALGGSPGLGIGNALGSNIANIGLVLGTTALIMPLVVHSETLRREFPILFVVMLVALGLILDDRLDRLDGALLLAGMAALLYGLANLALRQRSTNIGIDGDPLEQEYADELPPPMSTPGALVRVALGMAVLLGSSRLLVWGAVEIARWYDVSDLIIGLTVVAVGTSLPELAASVMSALKGEHDIAIGNVLGSNMFNLLAVLGIPGLIQPTAIEAEVFSRDYPVMIGLAVALFAMAYGFRGPGRVTRPEGAVLLAGYAGYLWLLYWGLAGGTVGGQPQA